MTRSRVWLVALFAVATLVVLPAPSTARADGAAADPGVTSTSILLGATASLSGPEAAYASVARGAEAYFAHVNGQGGVHGRRILYRVLDDAGDPTRALQATRRLVTGERVFAVVNAFGTEQNLATRGYLNAARVPQLFVGSGAATFGSDAEKFPSTLGFQPSYPAEGRVLGEYLARSRPTATVAVLAQNDSHGRELLGGFRRGVAGSGVEIAAVELYDTETAGIRSRMAELKGSGADTLAVFATPTFAAQAFASADNLGWSPAVLAGSDAAAARVMRRAARGGRSSLVQGAVSATFLRDPVDPVWRQDPAVRLYRSIMAKFAASRNAGDVLHVQGMAAAHTMVEVLRKAGRNLTRAAVLKTARTMRVSNNPFVLPGIAIRTGRQDQFPVEQLQLQRWENGRWRSFGALWGPR